MEGSNLTYAQITTISQNLQNYAKDMQTVLDEITSYVSKIGNEDVWGGSAAMESRNKFDSLQAKFADFYKAVNDFGDTLNKVAEIYEKFDKNVKTNASTLAN